MKVLPLGKIQRAPECGGETRPRRAVPARVLIDVPVAATCREDDVLEFTVYFLNKVLLSFGFGFDDGGVTIQCRLEERLGDIFYLYLQGEDDRVEGWEGIGAEAVG